MPAATSWLRPMPWYRFLCIGAGTGRGVSIIFKASGIAVAPAALKRVKATPQQVGLSQWERALNVQGAFRVPPTGLGEVAGRRLLLVDDVLTTGSTLDACARALLRAGAAEVNVLVFARVVAPVRPPI